MDDRQSAGDGRRIGRRRVLAGTAALGGAALLGGAAAADAAEPPPRAAAAQGRDTMIDGPAGRLAGRGEGPAGTARGGGDGRAAWRGRVEVWEGGGGWKQKRERD